MGKKVGLKVDWGCRYASTYQHRERGTWLPGATRDIQRTKQDGKLRHNFTIASFFSLFILRPTRMGRKKKKKEKKKEKYVDRFSLPLAPLVFLPSFSFGSYKKRKEKKNITDTTHSGQLPHEAKSNFVNEMAVVKQGCRPSHRGDPMKCARPRQRSDSECAVHPGGLLVCHDLAPSPQPCRLTNTIVRSYLRLLAPTVT